MKIIEIKPTKKFGGAWCAYEAPGVSPRYPGPAGKQFAIDYARNCRFGGTSGEIHVYDDTFGPNETTGAWSSRIALTSSGRLLYNLNP